MYAPLFEVLDKVDSLSTKCWLYMPETESWTLNSPAAVLESEEVPPELEDDPNSGIPKEALARKLMQALPVADLQDIVSNARSQKATVSPDEIFQAFLYYYDNDAYINFE